ncbi:hypothetical protein L218DRAFT_1008495 [Marasmius fiardii PR-910]|nr:hypothetical protein L218DRAFT_1008495 [Marasmius fiardii PR-910]
MIRSLLSSPSHPTSPSISNIPLEILLKIFENVVQLEYSPSVEGDGPWRLMGICKRWKEIVQASPNLWAHITILYANHESIYHGETLTFKKIQTRLNNCLSLSKNWPLTIRMLSTSPLLLGNLAVHSERWKTIYMVVDGFGVRLLHTLQLPILVSLTLIHENARPEDVFEDIGIEMEHATSLRHAGIAVRSYATINSHRPRVFLPWSQLTHLELDTRLNKLTLDSNPDSQSVTLPNLRHLHSTRDPRALKSFIAPLLQHLVLTTFKDPYRDRRVDHHWSFENVVTLIERSACRIHTLEFRVPTYATALSHEAVASVLEMAPDLTEFYFNVAHVQNLSNIQWSKFGALDGYFLRNVETITIDVSFSRFLKTTWESLSDLDVYEEEQRQVEFVREVVDTDFKVISDYNQSAELFLSMLENLPLLRRVEISHESPVYLEWFRAPSVLHRLRRLSRRMTLSVLPDVDYSETDFVSATVQHFIYNLKRLGQFCTLTRLISVFFIATLLASVVPR